MINRAGFKVYCIEVEDVLASHSLVVEAAVVGVPDDVLGERVHAYISWMEIRWTRTRSKLLFCPTIRL
ncbi:MAG: hypothetical protein HOY44_03535 [Maritimibacter sp.]|uniref:AMP-binding enzyme n=1 Tax=Maritimibacter sp. TaxID=2003363 RepID=UPI001D5BB22A|nr:hypothetical protein [Maritimibacter sp.]